MMDAAAQVTPVIGIIDAAARQQLRASEAEVEVIFDAPLEMFLQDTSAHKHKDVWWNDTIQYRSVWWQHHLTCFHGVVH